MNPNDTLVTPLLLPLIKMDIHAREMETGMPKFDNVFHEFETIYMELSKLTLSEVYVVQHAGETEIRIWENALAYQETKKKTKAKERKTLLREKE